MSDHSSIKLELKGDTLRTAPAKTISLFDMTNFRKYTAFVSRNILEKTLPKNQNISDFEIEKFSTDLLIA